MTNDQLQDLANYSTIISFGVLVLTLVASFVGIIFKGVMMYMDVDRLKTDVKELQIFIRNLPYSPQPVHINFGTPNTATASSPVITGLQQRTSEPPLQVPQPETQQQMM